jgi:ketosteroid isomerase-like protein
MNPQAAATAAEYAAASRARAERARDAARHETDPARKRALDRAVQIHECAAATQERAVDQLLRSRSAMETHGQAARWSARDLADLILPPRDAPPAPCRAATVVETFVNALVNRDLDAMLACLSEDVYFVSGGDFGGHAGVREWFLLDGVSCRPRQLVELVELDDCHVFAEIWTWRADGSEKHGCVYTVEDDKITAIELFANPEHAYRARDVVPG